MNSEKPNVWVRKGKQYKTKYFDALGELFKDLEQEVQEGHQDDAEKSGCKPA